MYNLGVTYAKSSGVTQNNNEVLTWYIFAAEQKFEGAKAKLEEMYKAGEANKSFNKHASGE
jgi:TPR repeat protein